MAKVTVSADDGREYVVLGDPLAVNVEVHVDGKRLYGGSLEEATRLFAGREPQFSEESLCDWQREERNAVQKLHPIAKAQVLSTFEEAVSVGGGANIKAWAHKDAVWTGSHRSEELTAALFEHDLAMLPGITLRTSKGADLAAIDFLRDAFEQGHPFRLVDLDGDYLAGRWRPEISVEPIVMTCRSAPEADAIRRVVGVLDRNYVVSSDIFDDWMQRRLDPVLSEGPAWWRDRLREQLVIFAKSGYRYGPGGRFDASTSQEELAAYEQHRIDAGHTGHEARLESSELDKDRLASNFCADKASRALALLRSIGSGRDDSEVVVDTAADILDLVAEAAERERSQSNTWRYDHECMGVALTDAAKMVLAAAACDPVRPPRCTRANGWVLLQHAMCGSTSVEGGVSALCEPAHRAGLIGYGIGAKTLPGALAEAHGSLAGILCPSIPHPESVLGFFDVRPTSKRKRGPTP